jgi:hypothetical protein
LAGNVFDWGAKEVALLMEEGSLDFRFKFKFSLHNRQDIDR